MSMTSNQSIALTFAQVRYPVWSRTIGCLLLALGPIGTATCATYEFPSCDRRSSAIHSIRIPDIYGVAGDRLVDDTLPKDHPGRSTFFRTYLFTTYPDFEPIETATAEQKKATAMALGTTTIPSAWLIHGNGIEFFLLRNKQRSASNIGGESGRQESPDGKYWVYPDYALRQGKPTHDGMNHYLPKAYGENVLIQCADQGIIELPSSGIRCNVLSRMTETPALSCLTVGFRIRAEDLPIWQKLDARLKRKIAAMASTR